MLCGNLGCVAYTYAKYLRRKNIDVKLLLWQWELKKTPRNPLKQDLELESLPEWIRFFSDTKNLFKEYRRVAKEFDIIHAFNLTPIHAQFTGRSFISHPCGSDAREYAFKKGLHPMLYRRAFRKNDVFFFNQCDYYDTVLPKLKIKNPMFIPPIIPENLELEMDCCVPERENVEELFFHPASHIHSIKGNDILLKAFSRYVKKYKPSAKLIMVEWGCDIELSKKLVNDLHLLDHVVFKKWLDKKNLLKYMWCSDLIFDQFVIPSGSLIQLEACTLGKPVVKYMDNNWYRVFDDMPFVSAGTVDEIFKVLGEFHNNLDKFKALGLSGKVFVNKHNHWETVTDKIIKNYEKILEKGSVRSR